MFIYAKDNGGVDDMTQCVCGAIGTDSPVTRVAQMRAVGAGQPPKSFTTSLTCISHGYIAHETKNEDLSPR